jgi:hypothetical protein
MITHAHEALHLVDPPPNSTVVRPPAGSSDTPGRIDAMVRRATAIGALGWLGYVGYLLRDCPASGPICQTSSFAISAAIGALGLVLLGHLAGRVARGLEGRFHAAHQAAR